MQTYLMINIKIKVTPSEASELSEEDTFSQGP